ncbi:Lrp/AsnC ligand binding domain-containing protein [Sulfurisphaera ohwakuensis]|uniref:DNA-binding Lrp family transcriptional regulator n=1 Tax=Sulfurisphaera ohwakuensis TaxID=69656 RepID=A0A650CEC6_SULOH|nr:Lrp/AsnC ligand binding domain-containing protein [Sulfurisphaera ohwakuensis]MBB5252877.1 DNA-binding Lrp family transcriptional regulator [Sulfurisphaera ohwakuensis]QGR16190.1 Lrp/AsnC family transcriptional regulator [Sulfurisphaera ohwakuensis]
MPVKAYILVVTAFGKETDVANSIKRINGVKEANPVYGEYDVVAEIVTDSLDELNKVISQIRKDPSILRTVTLIVM